MCTIQKEKQEYFCVISETLVQTFTIYLSTIFATVPKSTVFVFELRDLLTAEFLIVWVMIVMHFE